VKKFFSALFILMGLSAFASQNTDLVNVNATIGPVFSVTMNEPNSFNLIGSDGILILSREIGTTLVKCNYSSWKISVESSYRRGFEIGRLKLDDAAIYIPYTFALREGSTTLVSQFNTPSLGQPVTSISGASLTLIFYFNQADTTVWPQGVYRDTLFLSVTTD